MSFESIFFTDFKKKVKETLINYIKQLFIMK